MKDQSLVRRFGPWAIVWVFTLVMIVVSSVQSIDRYYNFQSGWPWDLAYNNQFYWSMIYGDQTLSVRPINSWGDEGPSIWSRTHLDPLRMVVVPFYLFKSSPETLLVVHNVILWMLIPAAYGLLYYETKSVAISLSGVALVPLAPVWWPLLWNDFREMELAIPFIVWAIHGYRARNLGLTILGVVGLLGAREELGVMVASLALIPPRDPEPISRTFKWARNIVAIGASWILFVFFGFEYWVISYAAPDHYLKHFGGYRASLWLTSQNAFDIVAVGLGGWLVLALFAPRVAILALPWLWGVSGGRWTLWSIEDWRWHHLRYITPIFAVLVAAGLIGYARIALWALPKPRGKLILATVWVLTLLGCAAGTWEVHNRMSRIEWLISPEEAKELWKWIDKVGPDDAVMAAYEATAPLSSRQLLFSNGLYQNEPPGYPLTFNERFGWLFLQVNKVDEKAVAAAGFKAVYRGSFLNVYHREPKFTEPLQKPVYLRRFSSDDILNSIVVYFYNMSSGIASIVVGIAIVLWARFRTRSLCRPDVGSADDSTGAELATSILKLGGVSGFVPVVARAPLANSVDVNRGELRLSEAVYHGRGASARAIAAHVAGHALQAAKYRWLYQLYVVFLGAARIGAMVAWLTIASGLLLSTPSLVSRGAMLFDLVVVALWVLRGVETNANRRVRNLLPLQRISVSELNFRRGLAAATWSEIAATIPLPKRGQPAR